MIKELINTDLNISERMVSKETNLRTLYKYRDELVLANRVLSIKVKDNRRELLERTLTKVNSRLIIAINYRIKDLRSDLPWYSLSKYFPI